MSYRDADLRSANWHHFTSKEDFNKVCSNAYNGVINWTGPGKYATVWYEEPCGRGCCTRDVCEAIPASQYASKIREQIRELMGLLRQAKN